MSGWRDDENAVLLFSVLEFFKLLAIIPFSFLLRDSSKIVAKLIGCDTVVTP